jgi:hypothetical protein
MSASQQRRKLGWSRFAPLLAVCLFAGCTTWAPLQKSLGLAEESAGSTLATGRQPSKGAVGLDSRARGIERSLGVVR